jgi:hypoxanthine phosphoribosyltransferase
MSILTTDKLKLELPDIARRLKNTVFPDVDAVVGIATGGVAFASMVAFWLELPLYIMNVNYRNDSNRPQRAKPESLAPFILEQPQRLLLVDDVSVTGQTLEFAKSLLSTHTITTFVLKGKADSVLYPEVRSCILLPWRDV